MILLVKLRKDLALNVFADKHSIGNSPERGLQIYFSASFHLEFKANPSGDKHSQQLYPDLACNAFRAVVNEYVDGSISSFKGYPGEEAVLEMVMFDLKDLASSLKLLIYEAEYLLEFVFSRVILALTPHSFRLNSGSSSSLLLEP